MEVLIANTFTDSLGRLTNDEQKAVKITVFDLHVNPESPGLNFEPVKGSKDPRFESARVSRGLRLIIHLTDATLLLCYVGHHDDAYRWAERRKIEAHPKTGAAQLVEVRESVREIELPVYVERGAEQTPASSRLLFEEISDERLLGYGVPEDWLQDVRRATEDTLFDLTPHLPEEAAEALLEIATGGTPEVVAAVAPPVGAAAFQADPFEHPDAKRRFRILSNRDELERALEYPWEKWTVFLAPCPASSRGTGLRRSSARRGLGGNREDHRCLAQDRPPGQKAQGITCSSHDFLRRARERSSLSVETAHR